MAPVEGRPLEDAELARRAREGDDDAYGLLVKRYGQIAFRVAWLVTRDRGEAEDAAQEAFVKAYYALPRFPATSNRKAPAPGKPSAPRQTWTASSPKPNLRAPRCCSTGTPTGASAAKSSNIRCSTTPRSSNASKAID